MGVIPRSFVDERATEDLSVELTERFFRLRPRMGAFRMTPRTVRSVALRVTRER